MHDNRVFESDKGGELILGGALTIENASVLKKKLLETLSKEDNVVVCIDANASVDISFLQLLCSAHRTASKLGKSFMIKPAEEGKFLIAVKNAGYTRRRGCIRDREGSCLWVGVAHV